jgi:hypothetical protein
MVFTSEGLFALEELFAFLNILSIRFDEFVSVFMPILENS